MTKSLICWYTWQISSVLFHILMFSIFLFALIYSEVKKFNHMREELLFNTTGEDKRFMNEWKYLTRWDHMIQICFWFICILVNLEDFLCKEEDKSISSLELIKLTPKSTKLRKLCDFFFHSLVFPLAVFVTLLYWSLKLLDSNLLTKSVPGANVHSPKILDHTVHTLITLACIIEFFLTYHKRPSWRFNIFVPIGFLSVYIVFNTWLIYFKNFSVYGVLNISFWVTLLIILISISVVILTCYILTKLHEIYWTEEKISNFLFSPEIQKALNNNFKG